MPGLPSQAPTSSTGLSYPEIKGYRIVQHIGGGGFSRVFRAITAANVRHKVAAIKVVSYAKPSSQTLHPQHAPDRAALKKEVQIHNVLKHKNVLEFLAVDEFMPGESRTSNYVPGLYMVLELGAGGDLFDKIAPDVGLDEDTAHFYFSQLIDGLEYIHSQGVAHRDVKPENLLLDADGCLKLADFGLCSVYRYKGKERQLKGACGSLPYIAPEMNGNPYRGEQADVWSTGVVLFALLVGNTPWDEPTRRSAEFVAYTRGQSYDPWPRIPDDALSLVRHMLCVDPDKRYTIAAIKEHRWFRRPNSLRSDPVTLAERLLHGLIVSGDMDFGLHSDGRRAPVPENISLTQPEAFGPGLQSFDERLPPSSAHPALGNGRGRAATTTTTNARHLAMSQQVSARRDNVPPASAADGAGLVAGAASSQFTQAMNHMTQWSAVAGGTARFSPHLTRLFCSAPPSDVVQRIVGILAELSIVYHAAPLGFRGDEEEHEAHGGHDIAEEAEGDGDSMMEDVEMSDGAAAPAAAAAARGTTGSSSSSAALVGSRGARIRVRTMDRRKCLLQGEVRVAEITRNGSPVLEDEDSESRVAKTYVLMRRSKGDPLEWRRLFRALANHESLKPLAVTSH